MCDTASNIIQHNDIYFIDKVLTINKSVTP